MMTLSSFTPDGKFLMTLENSGILHIEELASGTELLQQKFPRDNGAALAMSPDGKTLVVWSGANTRKLFFWELAERRRTTRSRGAAIMAFVAWCFQPTASPWPPAASSEPLIYLWDVTTRRMRSRLELRRRLLPQRSGLRPRRQDDRDRRFGPIGGKSSGAAASC